MIQPRENIVWVLDAGGEMTVFDADRLARSIHRLAPAGQKPDFDDLGLAITGAIQQHVHQNLGVQPVEVSALRQMVSALLKMLGYHEAARRYAGKTDSTEIRLDRLAGVSGCRGSGGFELGFYQRLDQALQVASAEGPVRVQISGLRACVLQLRGGRRWSRHCRQMADDIVAHVWARAAQLPQPCNAPLELAVWE